MHHHDLALRLIANFGKLLGLEGLTLQGGTHNCALEFDGNVTVTFEYHEPSGRMLLTAVVAALPPQGGESLMRELLSANLAEYLQGGLSLGMDSSSRSIVLVQGRGILELDDSTFETLVENFVNKAEAWQKHIGSWSAESSSQAQAAEVKPPSDGAVIFG